MHVRICVHTFDIQMYSRSYTDMWDRQCRHALTCTCTYVRIQICVTDSADIDLRMYLHTCVYSYVEQAEATWTHSYVCMYMTDLHMCACTYMRVHICRTRQCRH